MENSLRWWYTASKHCVLASTVFIIKVGGFYFVSYLMKAEENIEIQEICSTMSKHNMLHHELI